MLIYAAADIHGAQYRLNLILENIDDYNPDLVIICGDITQFGPGDVAKNFLNQINKKTFALHGNIDTPDVIKAISDSNAINLHRKKISYKNYDFIGIGGDITDPISEIYIENNSSQPVEKILDKKGILLTHVPPYNTQDKVFIGHHAGSKEIRKLVDKCKPFLVISGHIHENPGYTQVNNTTVINCSMGKKGQGSLIDINNGKIKVEMLE